MDSLTTQDPHAENTTPKQSCAEVTEHTTVRRMAKHTIGLFLLAFVVFMWTACNFLGSSIFADATYAKPFFLTYLNTSIFSVLLLPQLLKTVYARTRDGTLRASVRAFISRDTVRRFVSGPRELHHDENHSPGSETGLLENGEDAELSLGDTRMRMLPGTSCENEDEYLDAVSTARLSLTFCFLWFGANYFSLSALQFTSVASTTILTSTASIWTLVIGTVTGMETFTLEKLCGVLASFFGIVLISMVDINSVPSADNGPSPFSYGPNLATLLRNKPSLSARTLNEFPDKSASELILGDAMCLFSAIVYGLYTTTLKKNTLRAHPRTLHMPTFFGFVGVFNGIMLLPVFPILHFTEAEPFQWPPTRQIWAILLTQTFASLLSDVCWGYALAFTSPLVTTVGLSLTIPISLIGEIILQDRYNGWIYWLGAMIVVGGFVFVDREEVREEQEREREVEGTLQADRLLASGQNVSQGDSIRESRNFDAEEQGHTSSRTQYGSIDQSTHSRIGTASDAKGKNKK